MIIVVRLKDNYYMQVLEKYFNDGGPFVATNYTDVEEYKQFLKDVKTHNEFSFKSPGQREHRELLADKVKENITRYLNNINKNWKTTAFDYERIRKDKEHLLNQLHITIADLIYATTKNRTCLYYIDFIRQYIIL